MSKDSEQPDQHPAEPTDESLDTSDVRVGKAINREIDAGIDDREASTVSRIDSPGSPAEIADLLRVAGMIRGDRDPLADLVRLGIVQPCTDGSELRLDKYKILGLLGEGGMGIVLAAEDTKLHRQLAIKLLRPDVARSPAAIPRFFREARAIAALAHPNVVSIHAVGEAGGLPWYAMQFVRGPTVAQWVRRHGPRPAESVRKIAVGMFRGLRVIHDAGIVHRDIKSSNLLLEGIGPEDTEVDGPDRVKIADFGLVRWEESQT